MYILNEVGSNEHPVKMSYILAELQILDDNMDITNV